MENKNKIYSYKILIPALCIYVIFFILPTITGFFYSFTDWTPSKDKITFIGLENFKYIFKDDVILLALKNTLIFTLVNVVVKNVGGLLLAVALNSKIRMKNFFRAVFYTPAILSAVVVSLIFIPVFNPDAGLLNSFLRAIGLESLTQYWLSNIKIALYTVCAVSIWQWTGFQMTIYLAGLQTIPVDYYEAATIDGAGPVKKFFYVTIPLLAPSININVMLCLIGGLKVFGEVYALTGGGPGNATAVLQTQILSMFGEGRWGLGTALNILLFIGVSLIAVPLLLKMRKQEVEH